MSDINNIASAGNIVAAGVTGNPLYLLLIIPQILQRTSTYLHMQKSTELKTFEKDVEFLLYDKPIIRQQLNTSKYKDCEIRSLATHADIQQLRRLNLLDEHNSEVSKLEKEKSQAEHTLIKEAGYLFDMDSTPKLLNQAKQHLEATKFIDYSCLGISVICAMGLVVPLELIAFEGNNIDLLCIGLNEIISFKNLYSSCNQGMLNDSIQDAIKILKIKESKKNQFVNE